MSNAVSLARQGLLAAVAMAMALPVTALASSRTVSDEDLARASAAAVHGRVATVIPAWDA